MVSQSIIFKGEIVKKYPDPIRRKDSKYFFFWYTDPTGKRKKVSTGFGRGQKEQARQFIRDYIDRKSGGLSTSFRAYAEPYYTNSCPHANRLIQNGRTVGEAHQKKSRSLIVNHVFEDEFSYIPLNEIRRADVLDLRTRLVQAGNGENTVNKTVIAVQGILSEAFFRQDISYNPGAQIGQIKYEQKEKERLDAKEIQQLLSYSINPVGWRVYEIQRELLNSSPENYKTSYQATIKSELKISIPESEKAQRMALTGLLLNFLISTGTRIGEARAAIWGSINMDTGRMMIDRAFKTEKEIGPPKWGRVREIALPSSLLEQLKKWKTITYNDQPDDFIFCTADGGAVGVTWCRKNLLQYLDIVDQDENCEFSLDGRKLTPHCYRHSLNTNLLAAEVSPLLVQTYLGWSSDEAKILTRVQRGYTGLELLRLETVSETIETMYYSHNKMSLVQNI